VTCRRAAASPSPGAGAQIMPGPPAGGVRARAACEHGQVRAVPELLERPHRRDGAGEMHCDVLAGPLHASISLDAQPEKVAVLREHLRRRPGKVHRQGWHLFAEIGDPEDKAVGERVSRAPCRGRDRPSASFPRFRRHPRYSHQRYAAAAAAGVTSPTVVSGLVTCSSDLPAALTPRNISTTPPISMIAAPTRYPTNRPVLDEPLPISAP
jgi:hypothetical protein